MLKIVAIGGATLIAVSFSNTWPYIIRSPDGFVDTIKLFIRDFFNSFSVLINESLPITIVNFILPISIVAICIFLKRRYQSFCAHKKVYDKLAVANRYASLRLGQINEPSNEQIWEKDTISALRDIFRQNSNDVEIVWMKPKSSGSQTLALYLCSDNIDHEKKENYREFLASTGVAGTVWQAGKEDYYCPSKLNSSFEEKHGCKNKTYMAVPLEKTPCNEYGIISVGSDKGFEPTKADIKILELFATIILFHEKNGTNKKG